MADAPLNSSDRATSVENAARRFMATIFGVECSICVAIAIWPGIAVYAGRVFGIELHLEPGMIRVFAIGSAVSAAIARVVIGRQSGPSSTEVAWSEFASQTGGTFSNERRRPTKSGWEGGPAIRWRVQGAEVSLKGTVQNRNRYLTRVQAAVGLSRPFQFTLNPRNLLTKILSSPQVWGMMLVAVRNADESGESAEERRRAADRMAFLATPETTIGDSMFDEAFLLKSNDASAAREIFSDAGVGHWLRELNAKTKGWSLSLMATDTSDGYQVSMELPGLERDPETLRAAHSTVDAVLGRLRDRGMLARDKSAA